MPIRIKKDSGSNKSQRRISRGRRSSTHGSSGGGGLINILLPIFIKLFKKNPKIAIILILLGVGGYFLLSKSSISTDNSTLKSLLLSTGLEMDERVYDKAEVFEPLADNVNNPLPESVSLEEYCPKRMNQGGQGSCVGWSSAYAARTIMHARATGQDPDEVTFSPAYLYNQIALPNCQGTYLQNAMEVMNKGGLLPFSRFAYNENSCAKKPTNTELQAASDYRIKGFSRLSKDGDNYTTDLLAIKQNLAQGAPVVIGMMVGGSFMSNMRGKKVWTPTRSDYSMQGFGGHAICVIGYDDYFEGGAFQIMNSWGEDWGQNGLFWVRYNDFEYFTREAYGLYPMGNADAPTTTILEVEIGLIENATGKNIPLHQESGILYTSQKSISANTDFKVEVTNSLECYTYIFGAETDGSSYILFPYTKKHSPYCGITGTRLFPKDHSLYPDKIGERDYIAIVISRQKLDYNQLNEAFNQSSGNSYQEKVYNTLESELALDVKYLPGNKVSFSTNSSMKNTVAIVLGINK
ncbi:MAG: C1 family peptidase [Labilibaculum sp.]|nr:C1 family peptidase [Labilibaculum sp.]MBI9057282.1 C1 family peptidase [Labilibaculum sp.]